MECDIYRAANNRSTFLFVKKGTQVQPSIQEKLGKIDFYKTITFDENSPLIAVNPKEVILNILQQGFHIQQAEVKVETKVEKTSEAGAAIGGGLLAASLGLGPIGAILGAAAGYMIANATKEEEQNEF